MTDERYNEIIKNIRRPSNCESLKETRVNNGVWTTLESFTQTEDSKLRAIQNSVVKASINLTKMLDKGGQDMDSQILEWGMDSLAILGHANRWINLRRRDLHKKHIDPRLCSSAIPVTDQLYGDNMIKDIKDIQELNRISRKVGSQQSTTYPLYRSSFKSRSFGRPVFRGRGRFRGTGTTKHPRTNYTNYNNMNHASKNLKGEHRK
ncbi:hypothetical protein SNE40_008608 [Patella caerulea]|uniref:Uncharacterized protein n=1 Tax=Patella caerulea TaxID=87958 RepID=A0AAN8K0E1_PATCE